jgi:hypothetical protein
MTVDELYKARVKTDVEACLNKPTSTYPVDAPELGNSLLRSQIETLRDYEKRLYAPDIDRSWRSVDGTLHEWITPALSESDIFNTGFPHIASMLEYAANVKLRRFAVDQRIFDWVQSLAVQFNARLLRDREAWLNKTLAKKNVRWLK